jgi:hypothetical protein
MSEKLREIDRMIHLMIDKCSGCAEALVYYHGAAKQSTPQSGSANAVSGNFAQDMQRHRQEGHDQQLHELARARGWAP